METERLREYYSGKTVLVTGHTGFKGSWLTHILLSFGAKVIGVSLPPVSDRDIFVVTGLQSTVSHHEFDIRNAERLIALISAEKPDVVFHLAAQPLVRQSYAEPQTTMSTNVMGTVNILEAIRLSGSVKAAVIITTDKVYENKEWLYGYRESDPLGGYDPYSASKAAADIVTDSYRRSFFNENDYGEKHHTLIAIARAGNVIGGGDWGVDRLVPDIMRAAQGGTPVTLRNPGSVRPWEHVLEPLSGYLMLGARLGGGEKEFAGAWNFGPNSESWLSVGDVTRKVMELLGTGDISISSQPSFHESNMLTLDTTKAQRLLGWKPRFDINRTLSETVRWYKTVNTDKTKALAITQAQIASYFGLNK